MQVIKELPSPAESPLHFARKSYIGARLSFKQTNLPETNMLSVRSGTAGVPQFEDVRSSMDEINDDKLTLVVEKLITAERLREIEEEMANWKKSNEY